LKGNIKHPLSLRPRELFDRVSNFISTFYSGKSRFINLYTIVAVLFLFFYLRNCINDSTNEGNAYFESENYTKALELYNEYLLLHPQHLKTLYNRGRCYEAMGKYNLAADDYKEVLVRDTHNTRALLSLAQCYYKKKHYEWAENFCDKVIMIDDQNYLAHYFKARAYHKIGQFDDALDGYNAAIDINPDFGFAYFQRSSLMLSVGLRPYGCYDLRMADSLNVKGAKEALLKYCQ
jgi:tetratricopeptide (TPR) repeat protein